jgi:Na+/H+-dicarboxylate symporter
MGVAGIPAASLVAIAVILSAVGLPAEGIGALLVLDACWIWRAPPSMFSRMLLAL